MAGKKKLTAKVATNSRKSNPDRGSRKGEHRGGRQKGTPNKISADLREMIKGALDAVGGQTYLEKQARENPNAFLTLIGKTLPKELTGKDGKDLIPPLPGALHYVIVDPAAKPEK